MEWADIGVMYFVYSLIVEWQVAWEVGLAYAVHKANYFRPTLITTSINYLLDCLFDGLERSIAIALCFEVYLDEFGLIIERF